MVTRRGGYPWCSMPVVPCLIVVYDLRRITLQRIENALSELGYHLDNSLLCKLKRALFHYAEETQRENLAIAQEGQIPRQEVSSTATNTSPTVAAIRNRSTGGNESPIRRLSASERGARIDVLVAEIVGHRLVGDLASADVQSRQEIGILQQCLLVAFVGQRQGVRQGDVVEGIGGGIGHRPGMLATQ